MALKVLPFNNEFTKLSSTTEISNILIVEFDTLYPFLHFV